MLTPSKYLNSIGINCPFKPPVYPHNWCSSTVAAILDRQEYTGDTVNFRSFRQSFKLKKRLDKPQEEWKIFENIHEPIITQEMYDNVQRIRANVRRYPDGWGETAPLAGLFYCADCGGKMYVHRVNNGKRVSQYTCSQYSKVPVGTLCPTQHRIAEKVVLSLVSDTLHAIADYAKTDRAAFIRTVQEAQVNQQDSDIKKKRRRLAAAQKRTGELERLMRPSAGCPVCRSGRAVRQGTGRAFQGDHRVGEVRQGLRPGQAVSREIYCHD